MTPSKSPLLKKISNFFSEYSDLIKNKKLCVCLSGGADSVSLLLAANILSEKYGYELCACHFNHMIRGDEADRDEQFCKDLCGRLGIKIYVGREDVPARASFGKMSLEEAARYCRYEFFRRMRERYNIGYSLTAHTMNDNAETLLLNLIRGSGGNGTSAIAPKRMDVLRPMLEVTRDEVEDFLKALGQDYVTDSTNKNTEYTRNYIRNEIFPLLKKVNPNVIRNFSKYISSSRSDREYFDDEVEKYSDADLRKVHKSIRTRVILSKYKEFCRNIANADHLEKIDKAIMAGGRKIVTVNDECEAVVEKGRVQFYTPGDTRFLVYKKFAVDFSGINDIFDKNVTVYTDNALCRYGGVAETKIINTENIVGKVYARQRNSGDRICVKGINRSVKKLFNESKVPVEYRNLVPVIYDNEGIIYIPFVAVSDRVFTNDVTEKTRYVTTVMNTVVPERWKSAHETQK